MARKLVVPAFPRPRLLPWLLAAVSVAAIVFGIVSGIAGYIVLGVAGLFFVVAGYPLARLVLGRDPRENHDIDSEARPTDHP